jgi:ParB/RepB/Spo0J family partition protein
MNYQDLPLDRLVPSPLNPRKHFDEGKLRELAQSITGAGMIEPVIVRPNGSPGTFEIVAGARRYRAAQLAQLETVPAIVRELTDAQVLEIMVVENNQREDVNPLEEGDGFARLLKLGYDLDRLAERIGRSKKYIYDRIKLLELEPTARRLLLDGRMSAGHGILLARLKPEDQERALDPHNGGVFRREKAYEDLTDDDEDAYTGVVAGSVREFQSWLASHVRFDVAHAAKAAPLDFGDVAERVGAAAAKPGRGKKVIPITFSHVAPEDTRDDTERTYGSSAFRLADGQMHGARYRDGAAVAPVCDYSVLGVVVAGDRYGQAFEVCIARDRCEVHWKKEIAQKRKTQKLRESGKVVEADKAEKRQQETYESRWKRENEERKRSERAWDAVRDRAVTRLAEALSKAGATPMIVEAAFKAAIPHQDAADAKLLAKLLGPVTGKNVVVAILFAAILDDAAREIGGFSKIAKVYGVDLTDLRKEYEAALTPPAKAPAAMMATPKKARKTRAVRRQPGESNVERLKTEIAAREAKARGRKPTGKPQTSARKKKR